jgi:hypothetical protein
MAAVNTMSFVVSGDRTRRLVCIAVGCLAILAPLALQLAGVLPSQMSFGDGVIVLRSGMFELPRVPTLAFLTAATIGSIATGSLVVARFRDALVSTEQRLYFHTWLLRQFVPDDAYEEVAPGASASASLASVPRAPAAVPEPEPEPERARRPR